MNAIPQIGLFYGSSTCYTEMAAEKIRQTIDRLTGEPKVELFNITDTPVFKSLDYDFIVMGIPTWDFGELQEDWEEIWDDLAELDLTGKTVALFGLGDQVGYPEWFLDAMGYLHGVLEKQGARMIGYWPKEGYEFEESKALTPDGSHFVGLALDDENEFNLTQSRIDRWCEQILREYSL